LENGMSYLIKGVEALYPKIDRPYQWSDKENRSVPCAATDNGAEYIVNLKVPYDKALDLRKAMATAYQEKKEDSWPEFKDNFKLLEGSKKDKDAVFEVKARLKAAYNGEATKPVRQFDAQQNLLPDNFQLTTGSTVNVAVTFTPYAGKLGNGTSLRLYGVQVIQLAASNITSPFEKEEGFTFADANPFVEVEEKEVADKVSPVETSEGDGEWGEPEEPKKVAKKEKSPPKVKDDDDLDAIIDEWGDD
tara:strand:- start:572 stop:1312 length:741 start_codon:yes stop_codon:yes gene_type:complete